jgi:hypothetical protein
LGEMDWGAAGDALSLLVGPCYISILFPFSGLCQGWFLASSEAEAESSSNAGGGGEGAELGHTPRPRHQHSQSMDESMSIKAEQLVGGTGDGGDVVCRGQESSVCGETG